MSKKKKERFEALFCWCLIRLLLPQVHGSEFCFNVEFGATTVEFGIDHLLIGLIIFL